MLDPLKASQPSTIEVTLLLTISTSQRSCTSYVEKPKNVTFMQLPLWCSQPIEYPTASLIDPNGSPTIILALDFNFAPRYNIVYRRKGSHINGAQMSIQFYVQRIFKLDADAGSYVKKDTVVAQDTEGHWYFYAPPFGDNGHLKEGWPPCKARGIHLYRDYWRHLAASKGSPAMSWLENAPKTLLRGRLLNGQT